MSAQHKCTALSQCYGCWVSAVSSCSLTCCICGFVCSRVLLPAVHAFWPVLMSRWREASHEVAACWPFDGPLPESRVSGKGHDEESHGVYFGDGRTASSLHAGRDSSLLKLEQATPRSQLDMPPMGAVEDTTCTGDSDKSQRLTSSPPSRLSEHLAALVPTITSTTATTMHRNACQEAGNVKKRKALTLVPLLVCEETFHLCRPLCSFGGVSVTSMVRSFGCTNGMCAKLSGINGTVGNDYNRFCRG